MQLQILLLKVDTDQEPRDGDLKPLPEDLLGHYHVEGAYDAVALAFVPDAFSFANRNRLPMDDRIYLVEEALLLPVVPDQGGVMRW